MSERRFVDTNLIVRHLVQDHEEHSAAAAELFADCDRGALILVVLPAVLAECVFVLESFYERDRGDISKNLSHLIASPGVDVSEVAIHLDALSRYRKGKLHFVDCTVAAYAAAGELRVATFDKGFKKFPDVDLNDAGEAGDHVHLSSVAQG